MRRLVLLALAVALFGCGADAGSSPSSTLADGDEVVTTAATGDSGDREAASDPCATMVVDPADFVGDAYPELEELERGEIDGGWLRVDGVVGCLVALTEPGGDFRAVGVEGYVFDLSVSSP